MKIILAIVTVCLIAVSLPQNALSQGALAGNANKAVQITEARKANAVLMRQYTWNSRTELMEQGQVKDIRLELVNYGPDGQLQRTLVNDQAAPIPRGFLRKHMAEDAAKKTELYISGLRSLLEQYTLSSAGKVLDFMNQATTSGPDAGGLFVMTGRNVVLPGDSLSVWTDAATRQTRKIVVETVFQSDTVNLTATFKTLSSGLTYVAYAEVNVPAKQMTLQVQNFDYNRNN
jgi:hypothetical protein